MFFPICLAILWATGAVCYFTGLTVFAYFGAVFWAYMLIMDLIAHEHRPVGFVGLAAGIVFILLGFLFPFGGDVGFVTDFCGGVCFGGFFDITIQTIFWKKNRK